MNRLDCIEDVVQLIGEDERLSQWSCTEENSGIITLRYDDRLVVVAAHSQWSNPTILASLRKAGKKPGCTLFLLGSLEEFEELDSTEHAQLFALPSSATFWIAACNSVAGFASQKITELQLQLERARYESNLLVDIGRALSQERDTNRLMDLILRKAREVTNADAGSVYIVEGESEEVCERTIRFTESQNDSREIKVEGFTMPVSTSSIVGTCVLAGEVINIPDLYQLDKPGEGNNPWGFVHDQSFDQANNYQTHSIVTIPMISARNQVIGVIQLINRRKPGVVKLVERESFHEKLLPFDEASINYATTLTSQACIALENSLLYDEVKTLFEGFVHASVTAIESRDPTTSGHSERVADLTVGLAKVVDRADHGSYANLRFDPDEIKQIEYAALLHDFGKVGVREHVLVKPKKLYSHERDIIDIRFQYIRKCIELDRQNTKVGYLLEASAEQMAMQLAACDRDAENKIAEIDDFLRFVLKANEPSVLEEGGFERISEIAARTYFDSSGTESSYLSPEEVISLQVARGSLTQEERSEIESHVVHTINFLNQIPWGRTYRSIPEVAGAHHEKLDGTGYPHGLKAKDIPAPAKMMAISDVFDALTASDRPYKRAVPLTKALDIIQSEVKRGKLDAEIFDMFLEAKVFQLVVAS